MDLDIPCNRYTKYCKNTWSSCRLIEKQGATYLAETPHPYPRSHPTFIVIYRVSQFLVFCVVCWRVPTVHVVYFVFHLIPVLTIIKNVFKNSDGRQFPNYEQTGKSHVTSTHLAHKNTTTYDAGNPVPDLGQTQKYGGLNRLMGFQTSFLINWSPNGNTCINDKKLHIFACTQKEHILNYKYEWQHKHRQYNSRINECT